MISKSIEEEFLNETKDDIKRKESKKRKNSKAKGGLGERECKDILNKRFEGVATFTRTPQSGAFVGGGNRESRSYLSEEQKLMFTSDIFCNRSDFVFSIEHKSYEKLDFYEMFNESSNLHSWMKQADGDAASINKEPLLIVKTNNHKRIAFVNMTYLIENKVSVKPVFIHNDKGCYWLTDLLNFSDDFFFKK